jgi:hypothetical protein
MIKQLSITFTRQLKYITALICLAAMINSCQVRLVPQYSAELENQIINGAKMTDKLYLEMIDAPDDKKNYSLYSERYLDIESEINSILFKNQAREKAQDIIASVKILRDNFVKYKQDHKTRNTLSNPELILYNADLRAFWAPVLVQEKALGTAKY